ncbi:helix-turn-helix transcriptional regulator [Cytophaga hutchinsonii]|nr:YafY family protein [Cytophaga hutchinsonii]
MNRIDRLLGMITLLQAKKFVSAEKIADKFKISKRTVFRDIKAICEQGIPVGSEPNKGYFIVDGYFLPPVLFNNDEANALLLTESLVKGFADKSISKHYSNALDKIKAGLKQVDKDKLEHMQDAIKFQLPERMNNDFEYLSILQVAVSDKKIIYIDYKNNKEEVSKREIEPIGLIFYAFSWHLIGWCHHRKAYRDFKVSRIIQMKNTGVPFKKNKHMPLSEYMKELPVNY